MFPALKIYRQIYRQLLAVSPAQIDHIVRAYIAGQGRPYFEHKLGFETDDLAIKSRLDLGVGIIDFRGLYMNPGA
ncbi:MAG: hypothetical protein A3F73_13120 [Gallionellales bacterium RIFCSPLOWO2_12_FULL_59_22]|nr:MAG: hypothetical protein A3H99_00765 [Gallionellales bacterium RIFCSPLOWO2_02_FULL_59_110]OGT11914.1 MAG: hypothetical protein A3F73_13120 [Gallionellales bacterium RIFCSPLOWO2_12_FULL_59_22]